MKKIVTLKPKILKAIHWNGAVDMFLIFIISIKENNEIREYQMRNIGDFIHGIKNKKELNFANFKTETIGVSELDKESIEIVKKVLIPYGSDVKNSNQFFMNGTSIKISSENIENIFAVLKHDIISVEETKQKGGKNFSISLKYKMNFIDENPKIDFNIIKQGEKIYLELHETTLYNLILGKKHFFVEMNKALYKMDQNYKNYMYPLLDVFYKKIAKGERKIEIKNPQNFFNITLLKLKEYSDIKIEEELIQKYMLSDAKEKINISLKKDILNAICSFEYKNYNNKRNTVIEEKISNEFLNFGFKKTDFNIEEEGKKLVVS